MQPHSPRIGPYVQPVLGRCRRSADDMTAWLLGGRPLHGAQPDGLRGTEGTCDLGPFSGMPGPAGDERLEEAQYASGEVFPWACMGKKSV